MAVLTVRNVPEEVHRALRHGQSTEAEIREILSGAVKPEKRVRLGDALGALWCTVGLANEDLPIFDQVQEKTPAEPVRFERLSWIPTLFPKQ